MVTTVAASQLRHQHIIHAKLSLAEERDLTATHHHETPIQCPPIVTAQENDSDNTRLVMVESRPPNLAHKLYCMPPCFTRNPYSVCLLLSMSIYVYLP